MYKTPGCWLWAGAKTISGYGVFSIKDKKHLAHRVSYELTHDLELTPDVFVCHSCDTPLCINPSHLFAGGLILNKLDAEIKSAR